MKLILTFETSPDRVAKSPDGVTLKQAEQELLALKEELEEIPSEEGGITLTAEIVP